MKQRITIWIVTFFVGVIAMAQPQRKSQEEFEKGYQAFIIQQAKLTEKEAAAFFPIYKECQMKKHELNNQIWKLRREARGKELKEADYQRILEEIAKLRIQTDELEKSYLPKYHKVLSYKKIFDVQGAESRFHREMLKGINHQRREKGQKQK